MITHDDIILLIATMLELTLLAFIISRLINFVPTLILSIIRKVKNKSIIESTNTLEKSDFGLKTLFNRWFL